MKVVIYQGEHLTKRRMLSFCILIAATLIFKQISAK